MLKINTNQLAESQKNRLSNFLYHFVGQEAVLSDQSVDSYTINTDVLDEKMLSYLHEWMQSNNIQYTIEEVESKNLDLYQLPITGKKDITLYQTHVLLMQIPFLNNKTYPWYYCNFINIFYYKLCCYDYIDTENFFERLSYYSRITYQDIGNFNNQQSFIRALNKNNYIFFWADKYYLEESNAYCCYHDLHPVLIHGFDKSQECYYCSFFEINSGLHTTYIPMTSVHQSLDSARFYGADLVERPVAYIIKPEYFYGEYDSSIQRFLNELYDYINGKGDSNSIFYIIRRPVDRDRVSFGIDVTRELIAGLQNKHTAPFDYRLMHLIVENKKLLLERFEYFNSMICDEKLIELIDSYRQIVNAYESIRLRYIKFSMSENDMRTFYPSPKDDEHIRVLCEKLSHTFIEEKKQLATLYSIILQSLADKNDFKFKNMLEGETHLLSVESNMLVGKVNLQKIDNIRYIKIQNFGNYISGRIQINCNDNTVTQDVQGTYKTYDLYFPETKVLSISYTLTDFSMSEIIKPIYICGYYNNLQANLKNIYCSSIYSGRNDLTFSPRDTLSFDKESFWCPELSDNDRYILYELNREICVNKMTILQHHGALRLKRFCVLYSTDNINWGIALQINSEIGEKVYSETFAPVNGKYFKLIIDETVNDWLGYDLPNICFFDLNYE